MKWLSLSALIVILDQLTKYWVSHALTLGQSKPIFPGLNLVLAENRGAAFSFLAGQSGWQVFMFAIIAIAIIILFTVWLYKTPKGVLWQSLGLSLVIGGALGNLISRLAQGYVVDFIDVYVKHYHWPAFNVADSAICVGMVLVVLVSFKTGKRT
jgi:signal peptidase II